MKVVTRAVYQMVDHGLVLLEEDSYKYDGDVALAGGGPSDAEKQASAREQKLADTQVGIANNNNALQQDIFKTIKPFATSRMSGGLPFFSALTDFAGGTNARAFAPARANLIRGLTQAHASPESRLASLTDFDQQRARGFDSSLTNNLFTNEQAKQQGAQILSGQANQLNPLGWSQAGSQSSNPQMYQGMRSPSPWGIVGGAASGALSALPF